MGELMKGTSTSEEKKNLSLDDEIGHDFLTSWKLTTNGKDAMDFTAETPTRDRKKKFDFNKFDDFEFGEDFGKLPSFKMDMPDLDFASPYRKTENSKERSGKGSVIRKKDGKQALFSFNFDFNELEDFGLDSNLLKSDKEAETDNKEVQSNDKNDLFTGSRSNSITSISIVEKGMKDLSKSDEANSLNSERIICHKDIDVTSCSTLICNKSTEDLVSLEEQITTTLGNNNKEEKMKDHKEQLDMMTSESLHAQRGTLAPSTQSNEQIAQEIIFKSHPENIVEIIDYKSCKGQDKNAELLSSPDSRSSSCANASNWKCPPTCDSQPAEVTDKLEIYRNNENGKNREISAEEKSNHVMDVENASAPTISRKPGMETKNSDDTHNSVPRNILSTMSSDLRIKKLTPSVVNGNTLKPPGKSDKSESSHSSASKPKQDFDISYITLEKLHVSPASQKREPIVRTIQALQTDSFPQPSDKGTEKQGLPVQEDSTNKTELSISTSLKRLSRYKSSLSSSSMIGGLSHLKHCKIDSMEKVGVSSLKTDGTSENYILKTPRLKESTNQQENSIKQKKSKLVSISDKNMQTNVRNTPIVARTEITENHTSLSPSLKRKSVQEQSADPANLKSWKRSSESPTKKRNNMGKSSQIHVQPVLEWEEMEDCAKGELFSTPISSKSIPTNASMMDIEVPFVLEEDEHVKQAEACAKELDDICSVLKKKHEEAKDVLVRAVVNNNYLLMLNHPMHEDKIRSLRRLASRLLSKECSF